MVRRSLLCVAAIFVFATALPLFADDPLKVGPEIYKLKFENDRVRVMEVTFPPGAKVGLHSHPDHVAYVVEGGTLRMAAEGAKPNDINAKAGDTMFLDAQNHWAENVGTTTIKVVVVELKEPRPKVSKK